MQKMIVKSFRLPSLVVGKMKVMAKEEGVTQGELLQKLINAYELLELHEQYVADLQKMSQDQEYLREQQALAEEDYL